MITAGFFNILLNAYAQIIESAGAELVAIEDDSGRVVVTRERRAKPFKMIFQHGKTEGWCARRESNSRPFGS
jgi:hypothetical protein